MADDRFQYSTNSSRVSMSMAEIAGSIDKIDTSDRIFSVYSVDEMNTIKADYSDKLSSGDMAILFDLNELPVKLYVWSAVKKDWYVMPDLSVSGLVLTDATIAEKGIVQLASDGEQTSGKAVQSNDARLEKEIKIQATAPTTNKIWIDVSTPAKPKIKYHNGTDWQLVSGDELIVDASSNIATTYSSKKIEELLDGKALKVHSHSEITNHVSNTNNPHNVKADQVGGLTEAIANNSYVKGAYDLKHQHNNATVLNDLSAVDNNLYFKSVIVGLGDMKAIKYDTNGDGIVNAAEKLSNGPTSYSVSDIAGIASTAHTHSNKTIIDKIEEAFTTVQKDKLANIQDNANYYAHPTKHSASMIEETADKLFLTPTLQSLYADKYTKTENRYFINSKRNCS